VLGSFLIVAAAGCGRGPNAAPTEVAAPVPDLQTEAADTNGPAFAPAAVAEADLAAVVRGDNALAFDLYARLRGKDGNVYFSPFSVVTALCLASASARGDTAAEIARALHLELGPDRLHPARAALLARLVGGGKQRPYRLSIANALWLQRGYGFREDFLKLAHDHYGAAPREVDFARDPDAARRAINAWAQRQTGGKIKDLFGEGAVSPETRLALANAVYFKGDWDQQFKRNHTRDGDFQAGNAGKVRVPLMHQTATFPYLQADGLQLLELPYAGQELAMMILLPRKADGLAQLEESLSAGRLAGWVGQLRGRRVEVVLPKFRTACAYSLRGPLEALGVRAAFRPWAADFSGLSGQEGLYLGASVHKAFVDVHEEGTVAAAASAFENRASDSDDPLFRADHPFVFLIRDTRTGCVLFLGRVVNPTKEGVAPGRDPGN
jgi:serpin B